MVYIIIIVDDKTFHTSVRSTKYESKNTDYKRFVKERLMGLVTLLKEERRKGISGMKRRKKT